MFGYAFHAARKRPVFDTMFWLASSTITLLFGFFFFNYDPPPVPHGRDLPRQLPRLRPRLPGVEHRVPGGREPLDLLPLEVDAGRDDEAVVAEVALADADAPRVGLDSRRGLVDDLDAAGPESSVGKRQALDGPLPAQHEIAERAGDELAVGLDQHHFDGRVGDPDVPGRGGTAPTAADHYHPASALGRDVARHGPGAARESKSGAQAQPDTHTGGAEEISAGHHVHKRRLLGQLARFSTGIPKNLLGHLHHVNSVLC